MPSAAVLIASTEFLPALEQRAGVTGETLHFSDTQPLEALEAITRHQPSLVVLERFFAATPRGAALINRIKTDPRCANAEVRIVSHTGDYTRVVVKPAASVAPATAAAAATAGPPPPAKTAAAASKSAPPAPSTATTKGKASTPPATPAAHLDWRGTRRRPRVRMKDGLALQIDGKDAALVDLSEEGAQVVSTHSLRPNQRLRVSLPLEPDMRLRATVAWAFFELPKGPTPVPHYRAGLEFNDTDPRLAAFIQRHKRD